MTEREPETDLLRARAGALLAQARTQSAIIERVMTSASHDPALRSRLAAAAAQMAGVAEMLSHAAGASSLALHSGDLFALESAVQSGETAALVAAATTSQASAAGAAVLAARVAATSLATRQEVQTLSHDLFERRVFENYLHFTSPADEAAFRQREAEAKAYIQAQLARGTPEGNLNAGGGEQSYMLDAHAHGAGDSPDFLPTWNALAEKTRRQHAAMRAAGQSTEEYDRTVTAGVRRYLKEAKKLPDAAVDRILAGHANPLDAVKLSPDEGSGARGHAADAGRSREPAAHRPDALPEVVASPGATIPTTSAPVSLDAMTARLKAAGVRVTDTGDATPAHGITAAKPPARPGLAVPGG